MDWIKGLELAAKASLESEKEKAFQVWVEMIPHRKEAKSFNEFWNEITRKSLDDRPAEEILLELEEMEANFGDI